MPSNQRDRSRRAVLAGAAVALGGLSGCRDVLRNGDATDGPSGTDATDAPTPGSTATPYPGEGASATFRVVDAHTPTDDSADATFADDGVTVTGTMDPSGCNEPALGSVRHDAASGAVRLVVVGESPFGPTATVECGNASYDYRSEVTVETGRPESVTVVHDHEGREARTFTVERA